jgi:lipopolysaccharide transport system ATP-binding protein
MSNIAIKVDNLVKVYSLYDKPQDRLKEALNPFKKKYHQDFYALNDVSFEIKKGETVGIIGKNGAGKSTLLKIITGVLSSTSGRVEVNGKIASLLELGAGFNPEMTGLENIYLNGTIMGFTKVEIDAKVDAILEFADIGDFIYQPTKMYSSGMFARLAFAVAINVEPDILIVDEALSVGDIKFQLKCINKFKELQEIGVTILFVSHDIFIVRSFCNKAIWLLNAQVEEQGNVTEVTAHYNEYMHQNNECKSNLSETKKNGNNKNCILVSNFDAINRWGSHKGIIEFVEMYDNNMNAKDIFKLHELITVRMVVNLKDISEQKVSLAISIKDKNGIDLLVSTTQDQNLVINSSNNRVEVYFKFKNYFSSGEYILVAAVEDRANSAPDYLDYIEGAKYFKSEIDEILFGMFHQPVEQIISYRK